MSPYAFTPADVMLLVLLALGLPLRAWLAMRRLRAASEEEAAILRPALWTRAIITQWTLTGGVLWQWLAQHRPFEALSLNARFGWGAGGILLGLALMAIAMQPQRSQLAAAPAVVERLRSRLEGVKKLLPATREEWPRFVALAFTAGICEELLFRGFILWALAQALPEYWQAALAQAVLFGLAHAYQGPRGVFLTFMVGAFLTGVVWITGSLWPAMLAHALLDLNAGDLAIRIAALPATRAARPA
jgi:membrane protease YdiL (CAAX protease family)